MTSSIPDRVPTSLALGDGNPLSLAVDLAAMFGTAGQVIAIRTGLMLSGQMSFEESITMVMEKAEAMIDAATGASLAAAACADPVRVAQQALAPYSLRTRANAERLGA